MPEKLRLNRTIVRDLQPKRTRRIVYDTLVPNFALIVFPSGSRSFYRTGRIDGRPIRFLIGAFPAMTVEKARTKATELNGLIAAGGNPQASKREIKATMTFGELWEHYWETHAVPHKRESSRKSDKWLYDSFLVPWKSRRLTSVTPALFAQLRMRLAKNSVYNANRVRSLVSKMFGVAEEAGYKGENPVRGTKPFKENKRDRCLSPAELQALFAALETEANQVLADAVRFALWTGARRGNCLSARWEEVDFDRSIWTIPASKSKGKKPVCIPLSPQALAVLAKREQENKPSEWIFPGRISGHATEPKSLWKRVCTKAKVTDARFHDLRHTMASYGVTAGVPLLHVGKLLGHSTAAMTERYAHLQDEASRVAMDKTTTAIAKAVTPPDPQTNPEGK